mmetsp:Transcript_9531/g.38614  ORF Transcript_9531/g.38614 Transcript_9531/m.38614 type:complete len:207 (+) Transcript_9531:107-727(+)
MRYDTRRYWCGGLSPPFGCECDNGAPMGNMRIFPSSSTASGSSRSDSASAATLRLSSRISSSRISSSLTAHRNARQPSSASSSQDSRPEPHAHVSRTSSSVPGATSVPGREADADIPRRLARSAIAAPDTPRHSERSSSATSGPRVLRCPRPASLTRVPLRRRSLRRRHPSSSSLVFLPFSSQEFSRCPIPRRSRLHRVSLPRYVR